MRVCVVLCMSVAMVTLLQSVQSCSFLLEPVSRRRNPTTRNDREMCCGDKENEPSNQCGICGESVNGIKTSRKGGKSGHGMTTNYTAGDTATMVVKLTSAHGGYFEFRVCTSRIVTSGCFEENVLELVDVQGTRHSVEGQKPGNISVRVKIPENLSCQKCVLQWLYQADNEDGVQRNAIYDCADIQLRPNVGQPASVLPTTPAQGNFGAAGSVRREDLCPVVNDIHHECMVIGTVTHDDCCKRSLGYNTFNSADCLCSLISSVP